LPDGVSVQQHRYSNIEQVCRSIVEPGFVAPITVTAIGRDGVGKSARIEIEAARGRMQ
jgi:hypothetical protein